MNCLSVINPFLNSRNAAATAFIIGQVIYVAKNLDGFDWVATVVTILLTLCSLCYPLSVKNKRWLAGSGINLILAYLLIGFTAEGDGEILQKIGMITPLIQGVLLIKAGLFEQKRDNSQKAPSGFIKRIAMIPINYPIATGAAIEAPGIALVSIGAFMSLDLYLGFAALFWVLGNIFLFASDPALQKHFQRS